MFITSFSTAFASTRSGTRSHKFQEFLLSGERFSARGTVSDMRLHQGRACRVERAVEIGIDQLDAARAIVHP
jgi:hypothetical protein